MHKEGVFAFFSGATVARYKTLLRLFSSLDNAFSASEKELQETNWPDDIIQSFLLWREQVDYHAIATTLQKEDIRCISIQDPAYPPLLHQLHDPPFCLFIRGTLVPEAVRVSIVGPRKCSRYGKELVEHIVPQLVSHNVEIVSGLAFGIDAAAHRVTMASSGKTVAVLPGGIDTRSVAPQAHVGLAEDMLSHNGALVSEFPPNAEIGPHSFPRRNRIVAALSQATIVIEGRHKSGALITAKQAMDLGRDVCAVPQNIFQETSSGTNQLLKDGAHLITEADDILSLLDIDAIQQQQQARLTFPLLDDESMLLELLGPDATHIDTLSERANISAAVLGSQLSLLELKGYVQHVGNMCYKRRI